ncbi:hypothetical protein EA462_13085 [Natrarchaeobius halalkaliphilus]|uniref:Yip1 domain-containing protein n=1 Tax=Natrarchaeobius halalkaliphilus TaxID=1679091 RepID=A0A3N6LJ08_9EURY|nr:YIP1 family protein [Natrarchaeobius halalkaliphilus]RQG87801.1 hypothetical protein EA462_13085 [Natrarchaeobius halalkaliphilus]
MATGFVTDPEGFLRKKAATGRLWIPSLFAVLVGIALLSQTWLIRVQLGGEFLRVIDALIIWGMFRVIEGFIIWIYFIVAFWAMGIALGGKPLLGHVIRVAGWGLPPFIIAGLVWGAGYYYALRDATLLEYDLQGIEAEWELLADYKAQAVGDPYLVGATLLGSGVLLISAYIWVNGVKTACDLDKRNATIAVGVPLALYVLYRFLAIYGILPGP